MTQNQLSTMVTHEASLQHVENGITTLRKLLPGKDEFGDDAWGTPLQDHLNAALKGQRFNAKRGAEFQVSSVVVGVDTNKRDGIVQLMNPVVNVHGEMTVNARTDNSAVVVVSKTSAWTRSSAWDNNNKLSQMPEGARRRVADLVEDEVRKLIPDVSYWKVIGDEAWGVRLARDIDRSLSAAKTDIENAIEKLAQQAVWS